MKSQAVFFASLLIMFALVDCAPHPAQTSRPPSAKTTLSPGGCNCRCSLHHYDPICATNSRGERETFNNQCQLGCYNCTHDADYRIVLRKQCS